jgi:hypothetical protein
MYSSLGAVDVDGTEFRRRLTVSARLFVRSANSEQQRFPEAAAIRRARGG